MSLKGKSDKLDFTKIKNVCSSKEIIKKMKIQATDWEKIFSNHMSSKGFVSRIRQEFLQRNNRKIQNPVKKCANFSKGEYK